MPLPAACRAACVRFDTTCQNKYLRPCLTPTPLQKETDSPNTTATEAEKRKWPKNATKSEACVYNDWLRSFIYRCNKCLSAANGWWKSIRGPE